MKLRVEAKSIWNQQELSWCVLDALIEMAQHWPMETPWSHKLLIGTNISPCSLRIFGYFHHFCGWSWYKLMKSPFLPSRNPPWRWNAKHLIHRAHLLHGARGQWLRALRALRALWALWARGGAVFRSTLIPLTSGFLRPYQSTIPNISMLYIYRERENMIILYIYPYNIIYIWYLGICFSLYQASNIVLDEESNNLSDRSCAPCDPLPWWHEHGQPTRVHQKWPWCI